MFRDEGEEEKNKKNCRESTVTVQRALTRTATKEMHHFDQQNQTIFYYIQTINNELFFLLQLEQKYQMGDHINYIKDN